MADIDVSKINLPNDGNTYHFKDAELRNNVENTSIDAILYHLGFYLDENGGLCQTNSI